MFAAVDLGSNSFRLHIGHQAGNRMRVVKTAREPVRLAAGLDKDKTLSAESIADGVRALRSFKDILGQYDLTGVRVVATNTFRVARNVATFMPLMEQAIGYPIEVISGEEEGRLIYMGVAHEVARPLEARLVIDIGGGSTELIFGRGNDIEVVESFGIGTQQQSITFSRMARSMRAPSRPPSRRPGRASTTPPRCSSRAHGRPCTARPAPSAPLPK
jgi:exopolyphosphatase/guanosine-5'-triphosphate,3'-diphosphate pyrophosphatase